MSKALGFSSILIVLVLAVLVGCSSGLSAPSDDTSSKTNSGNGKNSAQGHTLVVDKANDPSTLDPGLQYNTDSYTVYRNIFDNLIHRDPDTQKILPWVAKSWKQDSPTQWTFTIRDDISFQNGDKLTPDDVKFSLDRILDPSFKSPQYSNFSDISKVKASGNTVIITTSKPSATLLSKLVSLSIVPKDYVKKKGDKDFNLHPMGSGPYALSEWKQGDQVVLTANKDYWNGAPEIKKVVFRNVPNAASRLADLQSGKADIAFSINPDDVSVVKSDPNLKVFSAPTERVAYLAFNALGDTPTKSVKVRQAIAYGINYKSMISSLLNGYGKPVKEVLTPVSFGYTDSIAGYSYNPSKAKALLKEAGYSNGVTVEFASSPAYDQRVIQAIQGDLSQVGIKVKIASTDQATFLKKVQDPSHNWGSIRMGNWSCSCLDADGTIYPLFHSNTIWSSYSNKNFDTIVEQARTTTDEDQRKEAYQKAFQILQDDVPGIGLYQAYAIYGGSKHLQYKPDAQENFFVADMKWKE
ncbi:ABC transporter substrate-binding protein [Pullulanibacillus camelliae]|uniref:ABC transporter substrate-binding protein n=1 Tax=Pullulanibacillus camelliae TaxID=1707096 RepID=A0A8J2Y9S1_9BACL|nr:ABC transporter substrate-binding protein [Pullulanibacillus camelliae]GGE27042.1 ABC transporter substrate-binding protein [Pullulanibacillus camelliae]